MPQILLRPEFQSVLVPLLVATLVSLLARPAPARWSWLGPVAGFTAAAWLITGLRLIPLNATRTILVIFWLAVAVGLVAELAGRWSAARRWLWPILAAAAVLWVFSTVLARAAPQTMLVIAAGAIIYALWMVTVTERLPAPPIRLHATAFAVPLATGFACVFGASALLGQLAIALAFAAGSGLLLALFGVEVPSSAALRIPVMLGSVLLGLGGVILASMPWYALVPLAAVPVVAGRMPLPANRVAAVFAVSLAALVPGAVAVALVLNTIDPSSYGYGG